jgi:Fur family transcriptional regulator, ferric uptake regulator
MEGSVSVSISTAQREEVNRLLERYMGDRGLKSTRQRNLIIDLFFALHGHLSVEEVWARVRQDDPRVSVATVYRTMKLLADSGLAHARNFGDGQTRYEAAIGREHHDHLICTRCSEIIEFENDQIERMQDAVAKRHGFRVDSHKMELYGVCKNCLRAAPS